MLEKNKEQNDILFKFEYEHKHNVRFLNKFKFFSMAAITIVCSVALSNIIYDYVNSFRTVKENNVALEMKNNPSPMIQESINPHGYTQQYNQDIGLTSIVKFNHLASNYGYNDKEFLSQLNLLLDGTSGIKIDQKSYNKFNDFLKSKPELYEKTIKVFNNNGYELISLLLTLENDKIKNNINNERKYLPSIQKAIDHSLNNELFNELSQNQNLSQTFKDEIGKIMIAKLNQKVLLLDQKYQQIHDLKIDVRTGNTQKNNSEPMNEKVFQAYKRFALIALTKQDTKNILDMYPDVKKYYNKNKHLLKGITLI